jgi:hypothetical protein
VKIDWNKTINLDGGSVIDIAPAPNGGRFLTVSGHHYTEDDFSEKKWQLIKVRLTANERELLKEEL